MTTRNFAPKFVVAAGKIAQSYIASTKGLVAAFGGVVLLGWMTVPVTAQDDNPFGQTDPATVGAQDDDPFSQPNPATPATQDDNPFGSSKPGAASPKLNILPKIDPNLDSATRLILESVRKSNPVTPLELAKAIQTMLDIEQYADAKYYLGVLIGTGADDKTIFEMHEILGPNPFLRIYYQTELLPEGRDYARRVFVTVRKEALAPARVDQLIKNLSHANIAYRSDAFHKLRRLGPPVIARMIEVFADQSRQPEFPFIREALANMASDATGPLVGAVRSNHPTIQLEAVSALGGIDSKLARDVLYRPVLASDVTPSLRKVAKQSAMQNMGGIPDKAQAQTHLQQQIKTYLMGRPNSDSDPFQKVAVWRWDAKKNELFQVQLSSATASRIIASDLSKDLLQINADMPANREMFLLTLLESLKRIAGPQQSIDTKTFMESLPGITVPEVNSVLEQALDLELFPAAIGACEVLRDHGGSELLTSVEGQPSALVRAIMTGQRHLQFAALQTITKINPQQAYQGSSYIVSLAIYLAASEGRATGLVGHRRLASGLTFASIMNRSGVSGVALTNSRKVFNQAVSDPDAELILITDTLNGPYFHELVFQLRSDWRSKQIPIGIMIRDLPQKLRAERTFNAEDRLEILALTDDAEVIARQVNRLRELQKPWPMTLVEKNEQSDFAMNWLNKIAADPKVYGFYDLLSYEQKLVPILFKHGYSPVVSQILSNLGTPAAQRALVNLASEAGLPMEQRLEASQAFEKAIARTGTLLTKTEIQQQYDRYNASESQPAEAQKILGQILDAIENRHRDKK